jgi:DNA repair protein RadD
MSNLKHSLMRLGDVSLQEIVGNETVRYLAILQQELTTSKLADILISRYGAEILADQQQALRGRIFDALQRSEALELAQQLGADLKMDPYLFLKTVRGSYGSIVFKTLCDHFSVPLPSVPKEEPDQVLSIEEIQPSYQVYNFQAHTINQAYTFLTRDPRRVLIHMPTGSGKTRSAMVLISRILNEYPERPIVVWLAHSEELCEQAAEEFTKAWRMLGTSQLKLGRLYANYDFDLANFDSGLIVAGLSKLYSRSLSEQAAFLKLKRKTGLLVMDEAHQAIAPTYNHLLDMLAPQGGSTSLLGLSATPGRSWLNVGEDEKLANLFCRQKVTLSTDREVDPITFLQEMGYLAKPEYIWLPFFPTLQLSQAEINDLASGLDVTPKTLAKLGDDVQRNILIIKSVMEHVVRGKKLIVFACSVEQAHMLSEVLVARGVRAAAVSSKTTPDQRRQIIIDYKVAGVIDVLVNYGVLTTGFDAPKTNVVVVARPTQSVVLYSQMIGRAMRGPRSGGNPTCTIITVKDSIPGFRSVYEGFTHWEDVWT